MTALAAHRVFLGDILDRQAARRKAIAPDDEFPPPPEIKSLRRADGSTAETKASKDNVVNYIPDEETIRNDYTAWYGVSGKVGAQYILGASNDEICEE
jgi:mRNA (2'-O-methyladenosine-N6-)-methyltransferase